MRKKLCEIVNLIDETLKKPGFPLLYKVFPSSKEGLIHAFLHMAPPSFQFDTQSASQMCGYYIRSIMSSAAESSETETPLVQFEDLLSLIKESNKEYDLFASYLFEAKYYCPYFQKIAEVIEVGKTHGQSWATDSNPFVKYFGQNNTYLTPPTLAYPKME